ncbi:hypothetical protein VC33_07705 [Pseudomonas fluorescens]|jgi:hypothetical protein|nr:hypothetical protein VC33_07705 [Pseudomonas fluorescens]OOG11263.1 hypothetical protein BMS17_03855 [Pseudomonas sp. C9]
MEGSGFFGVASKSLHRKYTSGLRWIAPGFKPSDYSMVVFGHEDLHPAVCGENLQNSSQKITGFKVVIKGHDQRPSDAP